MIQRSKKFNNRKRWRLYYRIAVRLWLNQKLLFAVDLSGQKNAGPKAIYETESVGQLNKLDDDGKATDASNDQSKFALTILEKIKEMRLTFS